MTPPTFPQTTRAGFVRSCPDTMSVEEVIERGKEAGLDVKASDVHAARYYMRQQEGQQLVKLPPRKSDPPPPRVESPPAEEKPPSVVNLVPKQAPESPKTPSSYDYFRSLVTRIGTTRARAWITEIEKELGVG